MADESLTGSPSPRSNPLLNGHSGAEEMLLRAWRSGRMPHAWLLTGPRGVGKATLAYRFARFALAEGAAEAENASQSGLFGGTSVPPPDTLGLDINHPVFRRVAAGGHPDLFTLERGLIHPETKKPTQEIVVGHVRRVNEQLRLTPVEGGWRVAVIDEAEAMNSNAANAFLKLLEEPPARSLILLVSHAPGRLLPTIRSRCRVLNLAALTDQQVDTLLKQYRPAMDVKDRATLIRLGTGSIGRALELEERGGVELYGELLALLGQLPKLDVPAIHAFAERMARGATASEDPAAGFRTTIELLTEWSSRLAKFSATQGSVWEDEAALTRRLAPAGALPWLDVVDRIRGLGSATEGVNLDRKQALIAAFLTVESAASRVAAR
jgi:DNA polymerase-3 subunit delta'